MTADETLRGPLSQEFLDDMPYDPNKLLLFDRILQVDREASRVVCSWLTKPDEPITSAQRSHPVHHPSHVSGALMVHSTGMLGFIHAYHLLDVRHRDGWIGYGTHIDKVVFRKLVVPGSIIEGTCTATKIRRGSWRHFVWYEFAMHVEGALCYESRQAAMWIDTSSEQGRAMAERGW